MRVPHVKPGQPLSHAALATCKSQKGAQRVVREKGKTGVERVASAGGCEGPCAQPSGTPCR